MGMALMGRSVMMNRIMVAAVLGVAACGMSVQALATPSASERQARHACMVSHLPGLVEQVNSHMSAWRAGHAGATVEQRRAERHSFSIQIREQNKPAITAARQACAHGNGAA